MKINKITLGFSILATAGLFVVGCNKKANVAPEADTEFKSSVDASFATALVTEIEDICGYLGENYSNLNCTYFSNVGPLTGVNPGLVLYSQPNSNITVLTYSNTVTCMDGKKRTGTITVDNSASSVVNNAKFYRDAGYVAKVTLSNYVVDGWVVKNNTTFTITNTTTFGYALASTPLTWKLDGDFSIYNGTSTTVATDSMTWKGSLTKTLTNSTNPLVCPSKTLAIRWTASTFSSSPGAKCTYAGTVKGVVSKNVPYIYEIKDGASNLLTRDFSCSPNKLTYSVTTSVTSPTLTYVTSEWHPVIQGVANYTVTGTKDPRIIDYGTGCDNVGLITIKGITYPVDFKK